MKKAFSVFLALVLAFCLSAPAFAFTAQLSAQNLSVNGNTVACEKYNIDGSNYFKLRDIAYLLNGTANQFQVAFNEATQTVSITTGVRYTPIGGELVVDKDNSATAKPCEHTIMVDGTVYSDLTVYDIGGYCFLKLRDLGTIMGFVVDYDVSTNTAIIQSQESGKISLSTEISVDGTPSCCEMYRISGKIYCKLRDIAYLLRGTPAKFSLGYDETTNSIIVVPGMPYEPVGSELVVGADKSATAVPSAQTIMINGSKHTDFTIYNIGGNNFYQLSELATYLGFVLFDGNKVFTDAAYITPDHLGAAAVFVTPAEQSVVDPWIKNALCKENELILAVKDGVGAPIFLAGYDANGRLVCIMSAQCNCFVYTFPVSIDTSQYEWKSMFIDADTFAPLTCAYLLEFPD